MGLINLLVFYSKKESKEDPNAEISPTWKVYKSFIFHPILMGVFFLWIDSTNFNAVFHDTK